MSYITFKNMATFGYRGVLRVQEGRRPAISLFLGPGSGHQPTLHELDILQKASRGSIDFVCKPYASRPEASRLEMHVLSAHLKTEYTTKNFARWLTFFKRIVLKWRINTLFEIAREK